MKQITTIPAWSYNESCMEAKRIYTNHLVLKWTCPKCKQKHIYTYDKIPLISYGSYCHVYYCKSFDINGDICGFESEDKMYYLHKINEDSVDLSFNALYDLKAYRVVKKLEEI